MKFTKKDYELLAMACQMSTGIIGAETSSVLRRKCLDASIYNVDTSDEAQLLAECFLEGGDSLPINASTTTTLARAVIAAAQNINNYRAVNLALARQLDEANAKLRVAEEVRDAAQAASTRGVEELRENRAIISNVNEAIRRAGIHCALTFWDAIDQIATQRNELRAALLEACNELDDTGGEFAISRATELRTIAGIGEP
jgi:hypothetical protein